MSVEHLRTTCCIAGGGPAGIMLGYLLARAGVAVTVLEKHEDFFRDFRGDTVHPSTLELMHELELLDDLLRLPHQKMTSARVLFGGESFEIANLRALNTPCPYIALMPQWDFLNFLSEKARRYSGFDLRMKHEAVSLVQDGGRICGVTAKTPTGTVTVEADLMVACDGRHSAMRAGARLPLKEIGVPIDVLWFRIGRDDRDPVQQVMGNINYGKALILLDRGDYFQTGLVIQKGSFAKLQEQGLGAFRNTIARMAPRLRRGVEELTSWEQVKLLSVQINRLTQWSRPGLLCIGDAAHAMSPAFGVGINLAIQDAVAAARILARALAEGRNVDALLDRVQRRREFPTRITQILQMFAHKGLSYVFRHSGPMQPPLPLRVMVRIPGIQHAVARVVAIGVRPEHIQPRPARCGLLRRSAAVCAGVATAVTVFWRGYRSSANPAWIK